MALIWWSVLLHDKNSTIYQYEIELNKLGKEMQQKHATVYPYLERGIIESKYERQNKMIMGEAMVFGLLLIIGIWLIQRAFNKELEANNKVKNFLLSITHELKSPLASINLVLDTIYKREMPRETVKELSQDAKKESNRLEKLINNILLSVKINKAYQYNFEQVEISQILDPILEKYNKDYAIVYNNGHKEKHINVDKEAFYSLMTNLIENAIKYGENSPIHITSEDDLKNHYITIADQGKGIEEKDMKRIFDQFVRLGNESTRQTKGTGLGLYIVKKIVEAHRGSISVEHNKPSGCIFKITIPKVKK